MCRGTCAGCGCRFWVSPVVWASWLGPVLGVLCNACAAGLRAPGSGLFAGLYYRLYRARRLKRLVSLRRARPWGVR